MSAWEAMTPGRSSIQKLGHAFQLCMPPSKFPLSAKRSHVGGNVASEAKGLGDALLAAFGILEPIAGAARGIDADDSVGANAQFAQPLADAAALADLREEIGANRPSPPIAEPPPVPPDGATTEPMTSSWREPVSELLRSSSLESMST